MAQHSPKDRRISKLKRERNQAWRDIDITIKAAKEIVVQNNAMTKELKRYISKYGELKDETVVAQGSVTDQLDAEAVAQPEEASVE